MVFENAVAHHSFSFAHFSCSTPKIMSSLLRAERDSQHQRQWLPTLRRSVLRRPGLSGCRQLLQQSLILQQSLMQEWLLQHQLRRSPRLPQPGLRLRTARVSHHQRWAIIVLSRKQFTGRPIISFVVLFPLSPEFTVASYALQHRDTGIVLTYRTSTYLPLSWDFHSISMPFYSKSRHCKRQIGYSQ